MPFPWKKAKVTGISRLVADLHQSPKRGGSLVVETGFPTSLIDLFVKNRDRLRKPSKRKPRSSPQIQTPPAHLPSSPPESSPSSPCKDELPSPEIDVGNLVFVKTECEERIAFRSAFKIFLAAVALAVSTRNLAVWIMMAAFLLVLIEFVGARFLGFLRPESKILFLDSWVRKGLSVLKRLDWEQGSSAQELVVKQSGTVFPDSCGLIELEDNCVEEIQIAEQEFHSVDKGCESESESLEAQMKVEEKEKRRKILISKSERSRSARIKANLIRKIVPKKLRNRKQQGGKYQDESCSQSGAELDKLEKMDVEKQGQGAGADGGEDEAQAAEEEEEESCKQVGEVPVQLLWVDAVKDKVGNDRKRKNSGYLILVVIVLGGLVGGRGFALLLTLVWCLIARYVGRIRRC